MSRRPSVLAVAIGFEVALLALALGLGAVVGAPAFGRARFGARGVGAGLAAGVGLAIVLLPAMGSSWPPLARLAETVRGFVREWFAGTSVAGLAAVSLAAGIAEEALFRGVVQGALEGPLGVAPAVALAAAGFGLAHAVTVTYAVVAAAVGVALGALFAATGDLAAPIAAHALYDLLALVWLTRAEPGGGSGLSTPEGRTR